MDANKSRGGEGVAGANVGKESGENVGAVCSIGGNVGAEKSRREDGGANCDTGKIGVDKNIVAENVIDESNGVVGGMCENLGARRVSRENRSAESDADKTCVDEIIFEATDCDSSTDSDISNTSQCTFSSGDLSGVFSDISFQSNIKEMLAFQNEESIEKITEMGFPREMVILAMSVTNNDTERALDYLIKQSNDTDSNAASALGAAGCDASTRNVGTNTSAISTRPLSPDNNSDRPKYDSDDGLVCNAAGSDPSSDHKMQHVSRSVKRTQPIVPQNVRFPYGRRPLLPDEDSLDAGGDGLHVRALENERVAEARSVRRRSGESGDAGPDPVALGVRPWWRSSEVFDFMSEKSGETTASSPRQSIELSASGSDKSAPFLEVGQDEGDGGIDDMSDERGARALSPTRLSREDDEALVRLTSLGFAPDVALQAYLSFDKDEEFAAHFLLSSEMGD